MNSFVPTDLFLYLILASVIALLGGLIFLYVRRLSAFLEKYGVPFAAGSMIITSLVGLLPEASHLIGANSFAIFVLAFLSTFIFEQLFAKLHHHDDAHSDHHALESSVPMVLVGDTIHNFIDGVAIATAYLINPGLALLTTLSTFFHEVPHEIGDFSILLKAGWEKAKIALVNVASALSALVGGLLMYQFSLSSDAQGYLLAATAGIFLYLGAIDFLPHAFARGSEASLKNNLRGIAPVIAGALIMFGALSAVPHSHERHVDDQEESHHLNEDRSHKEGLGNEGDDDH